MSLLNPLSSEAPFPNWIFVSIQTPFVGILTLPVMADSTSRHGSLPRSTPSLYSNVTQSAGPESVDWLPLTPSTNPKLSLVCGQQPLQLEELHEDIFKPSPAVVELPDPDQLILLGDNLKAAFIKMFAFDYDQADEGLNIGMNCFAYC